MNLLDGRIDQYQGLGWTFRVPAFCISRFLLQSQVLMNESDGHAAFAHSTRYSFDGVMPHVTSREHAREAGLQPVVQE